jgi:hypothetical protein
VSTTEIFIEQVIIGLLVLLIGCLLGGESSVRWVLNADLGSFVVVAALAYLLGIVFDRIGDTVLARLERHNRLHFAAEIAAGRDARKDREVALRDPFEEEKYRLGVLGPDGAAKYGDYLRSRIRLTRALAFSLPALALSSSVAAMDWDPDPSLSFQLVAMVRWAAAALLAAVYGLLVLRRSRSNSDVLVSTYVQEIPESTELDAELKAERQGHPRVVLRTRHMAARTVRDAYRGKTRRPDELARFVFRNDRALALTALLLCMLSVIPPMITHQGALGIGIALGGIVLTAVSGWCWWRISRTFFTFLRDFARSRPRRAFGR